jgi:hypothetical protein
MVNLTRIIGRIFLEERWKKLPEGGETNSQVQPG